ncbi:MAG TPA: carboxymuconolactone decarboxylase family protein [Candidatus Dormibacteraeota bacterium]
MDRGACERGLEIRREVLGDSYVAQAQSRVDEFTQPFQELLNGYCWGEIWGRPGLPRKVRSLLNLAMLTALNRPEELRLHLRGALRNGATREEIGEVLLQTAVYCGVPAANGAFREARQVFAEVDREGAGVAAE